jgi:two-component system, response regulator PdtaR
MANKVLIIEPEAILGLGMKVQFSQWGWTTIELTDSGESGIGLAQTIKPDLIVTNQELAGEMDGLETVRLIQNFHSAPFIFVHSRSPNREHKRRLRYINRYVWLVKPFQIEKLEAAVKQLLQSPHQKQG